ncbi:hypothetical protein [Arcticibacterium luteifluviistationis]|uniref:Cytochrome c domain-containing protein n=1 Tax=Arcticibacterium luteifluviistationis TaxID=1784714 RepID=A0A2Z4GDZ4_9BACT|nr:hypothetical protein [Arcticibacterium luteifluviistationis]AWV99370.1 hypothetical protein DJ013_14850 [Arcticibacterium luteifluviistationis]
MKVYNSLPMIALLGLLFSNCQSGNDTYAESHNFIQPTDPIDPKISGFNFPEDSTVIYNWLNTDNQDKIIKHAWGIWAAITPITSQKDSAGQFLRVFETWESPSELADRLKIGLTSQKQLRTPLKRPSQFAHAGLPLNIEVYETVAYSPSASKFAIENQVFKKSVVESYKKKNKIGKIPDFPNDAITCKPTYKVISKSSAISAIPIWLGMPSTPQAYGEKKWGTYVFIDTTNKGKGDGSFSTDSLNPTINNTYNLNDFIYFEVDQSSLSYIKTIDPIAEVGDYAILVAMHVGTKEITNWTWQSFWWTPDPSNPPFPSSSEIAHKKPSSIKNAPAHYAMTLSYAMVMPNQPVHGGTNSGVIPVFGFNPYLESAFDSTVFKFPNQLNPDLKFGIQTNCMSCHALANYSKNTPYSTAQYIDMQDKFFINKVQLDFAWSIQSNLIEN